MAMTANRTGKGKLAPPDCPHKGTLNKKPPVSDVRRRQEVFYTEMSARSVRIRFFDVQGSTIVEVQLILSCNSYGILCIV